MRRRNPAHIDDALLLRLEAEGDPAAEGNKDLSDFLDALETHAEGWMPTTIQGKRVRKYSRESFRKALAEKMSAWPMVTLYLERPPSPELLLKLGLGGGKDWSVYCTVRPFSFFQDPKNADERSQKLVALVRAWASRYPVTYVELHSEHDSELAFLQDQEAKVSDERVNHVYWLNVLGRKFVESIGRERVLSTPAHLVEELPFGSVLLVTRPTVADCISEEARLAQARALVHLRPELSFDAVMAKLRERSAALVPVEPCFHPDVAELLEEVSYKCSVGKRQLTIAELNAYQPPEVTEWLPREDAPGSDVPDPDKYAKRYRDDCAEGVEIVFQEEVPSVSEYNLGCLIGIDIYLWYEVWPERQKREYLDQKLNIWLGAYLGEVMRRRLGGQWVPRKNLLESQVLVGDRAWLPFLRVRHYLQTRQSLIDSSLEQFYRVAERHLREASSTGVPLPSTRE